MHTKQFHFCLPTHKWVQIHTKTSKRLFKAALFTIIVNWKPTNVHQQEGEWTHCNIYAYTMEYCKAMRISCIQQYRWISQTKCWGKRRQSAYFTIPFIEISKNRQNESVVIEFRRLINYLWGGFCWELWWHTGKRLTTSSQKNQNPWFYIIYQFSWYKFSHHGGFQATNAMSPSTELGRDLLCSGKLV